VGGGDAVQIGGFTIAGAAPKRVIVRAAGPALARLNVSEVLPDPVLRVYSGNTVVAQNDDWDATLASDFVAVGAFAWTPGSRDAALLLELPPGGYTAQVAGKNSAAGIALVEIYDADLFVPTTSSRLINLSTLSFVGTSDQEQIGGFVISGGAKQVLLRAAGPALSAFQVSGVLADPRLTLYAGSTPIGQNDDWDPSLGATFNALGAFNWETGSTDAATVVTLQPGAYTVHVTGHGATGIALFEIYTVE
jgi:hypothetical protein